MHVTKSAATTYLEQCLTEFCAFLYQLAVLFEDGTQEETQVLDEVLFVVTAVLVGLLDVCGQRQHLYNQPEDCMHDTLGCF